jgi:glycine dehydrogenase subunit 2
MATTNRRQQSEPTIFELSSPGREGFSLPPEEGAHDLPAELLRDELDGFPEASEVDVTRHFTRLSQKNYAIDIGMYPLGSCTMKYNPRVNEWAARLKGFAGLHPHTPPEHAQGALALMFHLERYLMAVSGFARVTLQPAAGAQGEYTALLMFRKALEQRGELGKRKKILIPDSAHGTNPASAVLAGFVPVEIPTTGDGTLPAEAVARFIDDELAGLMLTNPNTLGVFERELGAICTLVQDAGGYVYQDGANTNALMGRQRPGDVGVDAMHFNLHKTFSTPHGGGGPGAGAVGVAPRLVPFLPRPTVEQREDGTFYLDTDRPLSVGKVKSFLGQFGVLVRAYTYIRELGREGLARATDLAVLNANYLRAKLSDLYPLGYPADSLHEVVLTDKNLKGTKVKTLDIAKRLIDYGFHPPTVYFPLIVPGALMMEPTETESREELDAFITAMRAIFREAHEQPELLLNAPTTAPTRRLDETRAARKPILTYEPK